MEQESGRAIRIIYPIVPEVGLKRALSWNLFSELDTVSCLANLCVKQIPDRFGHSWIKIDPDFL